MQIKFVVIKLYCTFCIKPKLVLPSSLLENNSHASGLREILSSKGLPLSPSTKTATDKHHTSVVVQGGSAGIMRFLADIFPDDLGFLYPHDKLLRDQVKRNDSLIINVKKFYVLLSGCCP